MNKNPRVSIGLPVFNGENYLEETLQSILAQTFTDFELVISDNASTDSTQAICQAYAAHDRRIHYHRNQKNLGAAPNYNRVFELSSGEYFKWVAHDDPIAPEYLAKCVDVLDHNPKLVLCFTRAQVIDENSKLIREESFGTNIDFTMPQKRFRSLVLPLFNIPKAPIVVFGLIRANIAKKTGLIGSYPSSDVVLMAELSLYGEFYEIPEPLFLWRHHPNQSVRGELASDRKRTSWFDTKLERKFVMPKWLYLVGYLKAVQNSPLNVYSKLYCYLQIVRWAFIMRHFRSLVKDLLLALHHLFVIVPLKFLGHRRAIRKEPGQIEETC